MKTKELIKELQKFKSDEEVKINYNYTNHVCGDGDYCYCTSEDHVLSIQGIDFCKDLKIYGKTNKSKPSIIITVSL